ncbi:MAG: alpha/beta hydrolase [Pyrinomonadaceae bacterium]
MSGSSGGSHGSRAGDVCRQFLWLSGDRATRRERSPTVERAVMIAPTVEPGARQAWRQIMRLARTALVEPPALIALATMDYLRAGPRRVWRTFKFALADRIEEKLARTQAPTLVIRGGRDPLVSARWAAEAAAILPRGRLVIIPRAAHAVYYNSPRELSHIISEFMLRDDSSGAH